jgi:hypothetical protein
MSDFIHELKPLPSLPRLCGHKVFPCASKKWKFPCCKHASSCRRSKHPS